MPAADDVMAEQGGRPPSGMLQESMVDLRTGHEFDLAMWELDCASGLTSRNSTLLRLLGIDDEPATIRLDDLLQEHVHPDDLRMVKAALARALTSLEVTPVRIFHRLLSKDREIRLVEMRVQAYFDGHGPQRRAIRLAGVLFEVTDLVAEARQAESRVTFRTLADTMPQMVWSTLPDGYHDYYNARWYEFTGTRVGSTDGAGWNDMFHPDDRARAWEVWRNCLATGAPYDIEYRLRRHDGQYRWTLGRAMPIRDENGMITRWFGTCTDIDDQRQAAEVLSRSRIELERLVEERSASLVREAEERRLAEEALRRSEKLQAVGLLAGGLVHDINNVLQVVSNGVSLLRHVDPSPEKKVRIFDQMSRSIDTVQNLIKQMLSKARIAPVMHEALDLERWVDGMAVLLAQTLGSHVTLSTQFDVGLDTIDIDASQLEAAVLNIAVNARDAMPGGGTLTLHACNATLDRAAGRAAGAYVGFSFTDTGSGMSPDVLARAFEPFFTTKEIGHGTGLGLAQIYGFAKQAGGDVALHSTPGSGTRVTLYLPSAAHLSG